MTRKMTVLPTLPIAACESSGLVRLSDRLMYGSSGAGANVLKNVAKKAHHPRWKALMCGLANEKILSTVALCSAGSAREVGNALSPAYVRGRQSMVSTLIDRHVKGPAHDVGSATGIEAIGLAKVVQLLHLALELLDVLESRGGLLVHLAHRRDVWRGAERCRRGLRVGASGDEPAPCRQDARGCGTHAL